MSYMKTHRATEIEFDKLECGNIQQYQKDSPFSKSIPIMYEGAPCTVQTPWVKLLFGMQTYAYKGAGELARWSLALEIGNESIEHDAFSDFLTAIDDEAKKLDTLGPGGTYFSAIRASSNPEKYLPHIRVKVGEKYIADHQQLVADHYANLISDDELKQKRSKLKANIELHMDGEHIHCPSFGYLETVLKHGMKVRAVLKVNPVWFNHKQQYGVSYRLLRMEIAKFDSSFV